MNEKVDIDCGSNTILVDGSSISKTTSTTISGTVVPKVGSTTSSTSYTIGSGYTSGSSCTTGSFLPQYTTVSYPLSSIGVTSSNVHLELSGQVLKQLGIDDDYFLSPVYPINQEKNATIPKDPMIKSSISLNISTFITFHLVILLNISFSIIKYCPICVNPDFIIKIKISAKLPITNEF